MSASLKNHGADEEVEQMFEMGAETMALPLEEKMKFEQGDDGVSFGYVILSYTVLVCLCSRAYTQIQSRGRERGRRDWTEGHGGVHQRLEG